MNKQTIEINVPEGYEIAEGEQPRSPNVGEHFLSVDGWVQTAINKFKNNAKIILKKKEPDYIVRCDAAGRPAYVEIKALEDLMPIVRALRNGELLEEFEEGIIDSIEELIK